MPRIPQFTPKTSASGVPLRRLPQRDQNVDQARAIGRLGEATANLGTAVHRRQSQEESLRIMQQSSQLQTELTRDLQERLRTAQPGQDIVGEFQQHMADRVSQLQEGIETPAGQETLVKSATRLQGALLGSAFRGQAQLKETFALEAYSESMNQWAGALVANPDMLDVTVENHDNHVEQLVRSHGLSAEKASQLRRDGHKNLTRAAIRGQIRQDPDAAFEELMTGPIEDIDPNEQQLWIERAATESERQRRARMAEAEALRKAEERAQQQLEEETFKTGLELLHTDQLSTEWVFENRDNLDEPDYKTLLDKIGSGSNNRDEQVYASLRVRAGNGEDVTSQARGALENNDITASDFNILMNEIESNSAKAQVAPWYDQGREFIRLQIGGENANPFEAQVQGRVLDDWAQWAQAHPQATRQEAREAYRQMASEGLLIQGNVIALPRPRYLQGSIAEPDIGATVLETDRKFEEGEIDQFEYERQMLLIGDWEDRLEARARAQEIRKSRETRE